MFLKINKNEKVSHVILKILNSINSNVVFGITGGAIEPFYNAIYEKKDSLKIKNILMRHESGASFAAHGYYLSTNNMAVCCCTTGPAITNIITGVANAFSDEIPMLIITPQHNSDKLGKNIFQDTSSDAIDCVKLFSDITKYSSYISSPKEVISKIIKALTNALTHPLGPVHLNIQSSVFDMPINFEGFIKVIDNRKIEFIDIEKSKNIIKSLDSYINKTILVGNINKEESKMIEIISDVLDFNLITHPTSKKNINSSHPKYKGVFGFSGHKDAKETLEKSDLIITFNNKFTEMDTNKWSDLILNNKLIHVDHNADNFVYSYMAKEHIYSSTKEFLKLIFKNYKIDKNHSINYVKNNIIKNNKKEKEKIHPATLFEKIYTNMPENTQYLVETGNSWGWGTHFLDLNGNFNYHISMNFGTMAWTIGAAIGMSLGSKEKIVSFCGDGSYLMSSNELTVASEHNLNVIIIIVNDSNLGMVKHGQKLNNAKEIDYSLPNINYSEIAKASGIFSIKIKNKEDLNNINYNEIINYNGPILIDVDVDPDSIPPMAERILGLK